MLSSASVYSFPSYFVVHIHKFNRVSRLISTSISAGDVICISTRASCFVVSLTVFSDPQALSVLPRPSDLQTVNKLRFLLV